MPPQDNQKQYRPLPDGSYGEFPAGMSSDEIDREIDREYPGTQRAAQDAGTSARLGGQLADATKGWLARKWHEAITPSPPKLSELKPAPTAPGTKTEERPPMYGFEPTHVIGQTMRGLGELAKGTLGMRIPLTREGWREEFIEPAAEMARRAERTHGAERAARTAGMLIPMVGPAAVDLGEQAGRGDIGGALGRGIGMFGIGALGEGEAERPRAVETRPIPRIVERETQLPRGGGAGPRPPGPERQLTGGEPMGPIPPTTEYPREPVQGPPRGPRTQPAAEERRIQPVGELPAGQVERRRPLTPQSTEAEINAEARRQVQESGPGPTPLFEDWREANRRRIDEAIAQEQQQIPPVRKPPTQPGTPERPPPQRTPFEQWMDPIRHEFPDPAVRRFVRANGPEIVRATVNDPEALQAVHDLRNVEIRSAAANAGMDVTELDSRQKLIAQMLEQGRSPQDIVRLAKMGERQLPFQRIMSQPAAHIGPNERAVGIKNGKEMAFVINAHELGHSIFGGFADIPVNGMISHLNTQATPGARGAVLVDQSAWMDPQGNVDIDKVQANPEPLINLAVAGVAMNEVVNGIQRGSNPGMGGDMRGAAEIFRAMKMRPEHMQMVWDAGVDRVVEIIKSIPGLAEMVREEAGRREENLPIEWIMSKDRIDKINARAKQLRDAVGAKQQLELPLQTGIAGGGVPAPGGAGNLQAAGGAQGPVAPTGSQLLPAAGTAGRPLKPFRIPKLTFDLVTRDRYGVVQRHTIVAPTFIEAQKQLARIVPPRGTTLQVLGVTGPPIEQIPFAVKGERPLEPMIDEAKAEREANVKEEKSDRGLPVNPLTILTDKEGRQHAIGGLADMSKVPIERSKEIAEERKRNWLPDWEKWRNFYPDLRKAFVDQFRGESRRWATGWALTQRKGGPVPGLGQALKVEDIRQGFPPDSPGMGVQQIREALEGKTPSSGAAAKLHDFTDSMSGVTTRTWMGRDPRGLEPVAGDVHAARAAGYVDQPMLNWIRKEWGDDVANKFVVDLKSPPPSKEGAAVSGGVPDRYQYERINEWYNALKDEYNRGGENLLASAVQAEQWGAMGRSMGRNMQLPEQMIAENMRRIAYEVQPSAAAPFGEFWGQAWNEMSPREKAALTRKVSDVLMPILREEAGGRHRGLYYGPGGFEGQVTPGGVLDVLGSRAAAARTADLIGYLTQQFSVLESRPVGSGGGHWLDVTEPNSNILRDHQAVNDFWTAFRAAFPRAEGFQPLRVRGEPVGIRIVRIGGHLGLPATWEAIARAASEAADFVGIETMELKHGAADARMHQNDWRVNREGQQYLSRLTERGKPGLLNRLRDVYAPQVREVLENTLGKYRGP